MEVPDTQTGAGWILGLSALGGTLAQFVSTLAEDSLCFCCGSSLLTSTDGRGEVLLTCPRCGAEVATERSLVVQDPRAGSLQQAA